VRKGIFLAAGALLLAGASVYRAFLSLFCSFTTYDDTGYMLSLIQGFNERGNLYRETFSQYGPFYSEFYWFVGRILNVPITHDSIRLIVLVFWVGSSIAAAVLAYRITQRVWVALLVQAICFHALETLVGEPGHPISLAVGLLAALALAGNSLPESLERRGQAILMGTILGLLAMTKINLGLFAIAAVGTAWVYCSPPDLFGRLLRWTAAVSFGALGVLLVKPPWPPETRFAFVALFLCSLAASLVSVPGGKLEWPAFRRFGMWALGAFFLTVTLSISGALLSGTRWSDLMRGMIVRPMAMGEAFFGIPDMNRNAASVALFSLLGAIGWRLCRATPFRFRRGIDLALRVLFVAGITAWLMDYVAPWTVLSFVWIAALPPVSVRDETETDRTRFGRLTLVLLAVGQWLGVYPVSGAQIAIPSFFVSLCLIPVLQGLLLNLEGRDLFRFRFHYVIRLALPVVIIAAPVLALAKVWRENVRLHAYLYRVWAPLNLPGAQLLRPEPASAAVYRCLAENLRHSRLSFVTLPGMNSLYGWSERPTPTGFNVGFNFAFLSRPEQEKIVEVARRCKPIALVLNEDLMFFWSRGRFQASGPLVDFAKTECRSAGSVQGYHLMSLNSEPLPTLTYCASVKAAIPNGASRITVTLPSRLGNVTAASLRNLRAPALPRKLLPLEAGPAASNESGAPGDIREFTFQEPSSDLSIETLDQFIVQLWNEAGEWVTDLPFALLADGRQDHPLSGQ
jgi:hypothetical protein